MAMLKDIVKAVIDRKGELNKVNSNLNCFEPVLFKIKNRTFGVAYTSFTTSPQTSPMKLYSTGEFIPVILLPDYMSDFCYKTQKFIILHEIGHIMNGHIDKNLSDLKNGNLTKVIVNGIMTNVVIRPLAAFLGTSLGMENKADEYACKYGMLTSKDALNAINDVINTSPDYEIGFLESIAKKEIGSRYHHLLAMGY